MREPLRIDPDIRRAATLPAWVYTDPDVFEHERTRVFATSWQLAADTDRLKVPGQIVPFVFLEGALEEPLLLTRDAEDRVHALSNVCTHRGHLVAEHEAVANGLRCRYHGRRFDLDGRCRFMPEFEGVEGFPSAADDLPHVPTATWQKFVFAALEPECAFDAWVAELEARCGFLPVPNAQLDSTRSRDYLVRANWALYCDNYLEGFHIPYVHGALADILDYGSYRTELFARASLQIGIARDGEDCFDLPPSSPDRGQRVAAYYFFLFPNTLFNVYPWGISINVVKPLAVDRTKVSFLSYVWDESRIDSGAGAALDRVEREDETIVENVQRGVRSRLYDRGRYSPVREQGVHHFHRLLAERLSEAGVERGTPR